MTAPKVRPGFILVAISVASGLTVSGCYTLLRHPRVAFNDAATETVEIAHEPIAVHWRDDCVGCHTDAVPYYNPALPDGFYQDRGYESWIWFYELPWWSDPVSYYPDETDEQGLPSPRRFGRRGSTRTRPPDLPPAAVAPSLPTVGGSVAKVGADSSGTAEKQPAKRKAKGERSDNPKRRTRKKPGGG